MIRIETQNKYAEGQRDSATYFLELVYCTKYQFCKETERRLIPTDKYELFCVISGEVFLSSHKRKIGKNGIIIVRKFSQPELQFKENTEVIHIGFITSLDFPFFDGGDNLVTFESLVTFSLVNKLYRLVCLKNQALGIKEALLLELLCDMGEYSKATLSEIALYQQACDWIEKNSSRAITAQDVAAALNCSRAHLNRVVKATNGECLGNIIARYRLERIKILCDSGNMSAHEIANRLDFYSTELLCKFFKYHEGISINKYKNKIKM